MICSIPAEDSRKNLKASGKTAPLNGTCSRARQLRGANHPTAGAAARHCLCSAHPFEIGIGDEGKDRVSASRARRALRQAIGADGDSDIVAIGAACAPGCRRRTHRRWRGVVEGRGRELDRTVCSVGGRWTNGDSFGNVRRSATRESDDGGKDKRGKDEERAKVAAHGRPPARLGIEANLLGCPPNNYFPLYIPRRLLTEWFWEPASPPGLDPWERPPDGGAFLRPRSPYAGRLRRATPDAQCAAPVTTWD